MNVEVLRTFLTSLFQYRVANPQQALPTQVPVFGSDSLDNFIDKHQLSLEEVVLLLLSMTPYFDPNFLVDVYKEIYKTHTDNPILGGVKGKNHRGILPNGDLLLYLLAGQNLGLRMDCLQLLDESHLFFRKKIIVSSEKSNGEPYTGCVLLINREYLELFLYGKQYRPALSSTFPAQHLETNLNWDDLILSDQTYQQLQEIQIWLTHNAVLLRDPHLGRKLKTGYVALFYGPSGTGKTLTATLLGKYTGKDVYRIDLSQVISKYIGETEKNLSLIFDEAMDRDWILFFDEADSIFGKRTSVKDAHDKYANQEVSYLLQKVENHPGLVILASNFKGNIDAAFTRRFQSIIEFDMPKASERLKLWQHSVPASLPLEDQGLLEVLARKYELNGANILNVLHYAGLQSLNLGDRVIKTPTLLKGIKREYKKEGKLI